MKGILLRQKKPKKKRYIIVFLLIIILVFFVLYKYILFKNIFVFLQQKTGYFKNYSIEVSSVKGGILSDLKLTDVVVKEKINKYQPDSRVLTVSELNIKFSVLDLIQKYFYNKPIKDINIDLKYPVFYLNTSSTFDSSNSIKNLLKCFDRFCQDSSVIINRNIYIKVIKGSFINRDSGVEFIKNMNANIISDSKKNIDFEDIKLVFFETPLRIDGNIEKENVSLNISSDSNVLDFDILLEGKINNYKFESVLKLYGGLKYCMGGNIFLKDSRIIFDKVYLIPKCELTPGINRKIEINSFPGETANVYKINGWYSYIDKLGNFEVKGISKRNKKYRKLYYSDYNFNQIFGIKIDFSNFPKTDFEFQIKRLISNDLNYISNFFLTGEFGLDKSYIFKGNIYSQGSILNYQPFYELESKIKLTEDNLKIEAFKLKDMLKLNFLMDFNNKGKMNLKLETDWIDIGMFVNKFYPEIVDNIEGETRVNLVMEGKLDNPNISGNAVAKHGIISEQSFVLLETNFKGDREWLEFYDSQLLQKNSYYDIFGGISLDDMGMDISDFFRKVKLIPNKEAFTWQGWTFLKKNKEERLELEKELSEDFKVGFTTQLDNKISAGKERYNGKNGMEVEYSLTGDKSLKLEFKQDEEIFGLQQSVEF